MPDAGKVLGCFSVGLGVAFILYNVSEVEGRITKGIKQKNALLKE